MQCIVGWAWANENTLTIFYPCSIAQIGVAIEDPGRSMIEFNTVTVGQAEV